MGLAEVVANREGAGEGQRFIEGQRPGTVGAADDLDAEHVERVAHGSVQLGTRGGTQLGAAQAELHDDRARAFRLRRKVLRQRCRGDGFGRGDCGFARDRLAGRFRRECLGGAGGACRGYALCEPGWAAEVELGQPRRHYRVCARGLGRHRRAEQAARRCEGGKTGDETERSDTAQEAGRHGETLTDIKAGTVVAVDTKCLPNCALRCAGNWRYTRQAYWARASMQSLPLSCEQAAL